MKKTQVKCLNCEKQFEKANKEIKRSPNHFCTKSCRTSYYNRLNPKRLPEGNCLKCKCLISKNKNYCDYCYIELRNLKISFKFNVSNQQIRKSARQICKNIGLNSCKNCGYNKHIEICHIKPIRNFPKDTPIEIINDPKNLLPLCRNCHWEFDKGLLKI